MMLSLFSCNFIPESSFFVYCFVPFSFPPPLRWDLEECRGGGCGDLSALLRLGSAHDQWLGSVCGDGDG